MSGPAWAAAALAALAAGGLCFGLWQWAQRRRTLRTLNRMLEQAIAGGFAESHFDESELSALEAKLARFLRGCAQARGRLEKEQGAVKALIADIAHQTRTPVANLLLYAGLLEESGLPPRQRQQARAIRAQGEKLSFLIGALVKASRLETGVVAPAPAGHPVGPLLEEVAAQEGQAAREKGVALQVLPAAGTASFDPRWTGEALGNVVNNAVKYTPAGGAVTVGARMLEGFCRIDVTDSGPGIPEGEQGEIFNRFFRGAAARSAEGLGLGLYLAREILSLQGGYIKVSSRPGQGATFSLYLPRETGRA